MQLRTDLTLSTFDSENYLAPLNAELASAFSQGRSREEMLSLLMRRASILANTGASRQEGGPFGALIVDFHTESGVPEVVGVGTNHVVPYNDPSAHAEMTAIRDAAKRLGRTDLHGLTLVTSCECCPMCLGAATGTGLERIYFSATRDDAARVGFSDADQYRLMSAGGMEQHATHAPDADALDAVLQGNGAAVVVEYQGARHVFHGNDQTDELGDPTAIASVRAVRNACRALKVFHLPEDAQLVTRDKPHPMALVVADWARIGRRRDPATPDDPSHDQPEKDTSRILYRNDTWEEMRIRNERGTTRVIDPEAIWRDITLSPSARALQAEQVDHNLGTTRQIAFDTWERLVLGNDMPRY